MLLPVVLDGLCGFRRLRDAADLASRNYPAPAGVGNGLHSGVRCLIRNPYRLEVCCAAKRKGLARGFDMFGPRGKPPKSRQLAVHAFQSLGKDLHLLSWLLGRAREAFAARVRLAADFPRLLSELRSGLVTHFPKTLARVLQTFAVEFVDGRMVGGADQRKRLIIEKAAFRCDREGHGFTPNSGDCGGPNI
ncbi:hypothetical protein [Hyphomicrobium sp.]|uniref:hypothetical protein n=1 Tax=Hyphomicrobium sp. TaxID=82 RepID=UPI002FDE4AE4